MTGGAGVSRAVRHDRSRGRRRASLAQRARPDPWQDRDPARAAGPAREPLRCNGRRSHARLSRRRRLRQRHRVPLSRRRDAHLPLSRAQRVECPNLSPRVAHGGGSSVPFTLIGTDGGLLPSPIACNEAFIASAERIDILVDLSDASVGDTLVLETRAFDPMHMEMGASDDCLDRRRRSCGDGTRDAAHRATRRRRRRRSRRHGAWRQLSRRRAARTAATAGAPAHCLRRTRSGATVADRADQDRRQQPSARCGWGSPRDAGASTTACSSWARRRSK